MLQSLHEQKMVLGIYIAGNGQSENLCTNQCALVEKTIAVIASFEEVTRKISSHNSLASDVIPAITMLHRLLNRETDKRLMVLKP